MSSDEPVIKGLSDNKGRPNKKLIPSDPNQPSMLKFVKQIKEESKQ